MRKIKFLVVLMLFSVNCFGQFMFPKHVRQFVDEKKYELLDSLPIERLQTYVPDSNLIQHIQEHTGNKLQKNQIIQLGAYEYMFELPTSEKIVLRYNKDKTKAVIIDTSNTLHGFGLHFFEFNVKDNDRRQTFYYDDENILCGFAYDKQYKVAKYFSYTKKEIGKRQFNRMRKTFRRNF